MVEDLIAQLKEKGAFLPDPAERGSVLETLVELQDDGLDLGDDYVEFLELCDGLHWEGLVFYGVESLPPDDMGRMVHGITVQNEKYQGRLPEGQVLIGRTTDGLIFTCSAAEGRYYELDDASLDQFESFDGFEALLKAKIAEKLAVLREQGISV